MLTRQGWLLLLAAAGLVLAGRVFSVIEFFVAGAAAGLLPLVALAYVRLVRLRLRVSRTITPTRVHAGDTTRVELAAANHGRRRTPVLSLRDPVGGTRGARLYLAPLRPGERARATYRLPTSRRGVLQVGPLTLEIADPFGLATRRATGAPSLEVTVFPQVERIVALRGGGDRNPLGSVAHRNALGRQGDDFYALREYVLGDDLRRVHWKSTARSEDLMVRQDELPWLEKTTVVLDARRAAHTEESFERAVSAAASVVTAATRGGQVVRLLASSGTDSEPGTGIAHTDAILEALARIDPSSGGSLRRVLDGLSRMSHAGGTLVVIVGRITTPEVDALVPLRRWFKKVVLVITQAPLPDRRPGHAALTIVPTTRDGALRQAWRHTAAGDRTEVSA